MEQLLADARDHGYLDTKLQARLLQCLEADCRQQHRDGVDDKHEEIMEQHEKYENSHVFVHVLCMFLFVLMFP